MIKSQHRALYVSFFNIYTKLMIRWHFYRVVYRGGFEDLGLPVLMIGNHFSWWDGFIANLININILRRRIHVMMLEEQLSGRQFLNKAGAYSIKRNSRSVLESLKYSAELLSYDNNLVVLYPQGEFQSLYQFPVRFEKGVRVIAAHANHKFHLLFYVALPEYFSRAKPSLAIYYKEAPAGLALRPGELETEYNRFLEACIKQQNPD